MTDTTPYTVPKERGRWRALTLAAVVHAVLFLMLWIGVNWQSEPPGTIEAEVWSPTPQTAAPRPQPEPVVEPPPPPVIKEQPRPEPPPPPPKPETKPEVKPDIALEQEKKRKEEAARKRAAEEELKRREQARLEQEKKKREQEQRLAAEKKRKEEQARLAREKAAAEEKARQEREAAEEAAREKAREEELNRLKGAVGSGGNGQAARSQGSTDASYAGKVRALIISNTVFNVPPTLVGNPPVEYAVELLPDGTLRNPPRLLKSSGIAGFDDAVLRAIQKSQPFPRDSKGVIPSSITISHRPKDQ